MDQATRAIVLRDIGAIYEKIQQCYRSKNDLEHQIRRERDSKIELQALIVGDEKRKADGKRTRYDAIEMKKNIDRCDDNITLFEKTIATEDATIDRFKSVIKTLEEDMAREPKVITIDVGVKPQLFRDL